MDIPVDSMCATARCTVVECTIMLLKGRWHCLDATGGTPSYRLEKAYKIAKACAVQHNVAQIRNVASPSVTDDYVASNPDLYLQSFETNTVCVWM